MTVLYGILAIIGAVVLLTLWCVWFLKTEQKRIDKNKAKGIWYDERQITAHGKAYAFAASAGTMYYFVAYICFKVWQFQKCEARIDPTILIVGGLWLVLVSYHLGCLMTDSVLPIGNYSFPIVAYIVIGVLKISDGTEFALFLSVPLSGEGSEAWEDIMMGIAFTVIGVIHLIAYFRNKRKRDE